MEHIIHAANAERDRDQYRAYVTDALKAVAGNTRYHLVYTKDGAEFVEVGGTFEKRWLEIAMSQKPEPEPEEDNRTVSEIIDHIWSAIEA